VAAAAKKKPVTPAVLRKLRSLVDDASRERYLKSRPDLLRKSVALHLNEVLRSDLRSETRQALSLAEAAVSIARRVRSREALGRSLRSKANALYILGENKSALEFHAEALRVFRELGDNREQARTLIPTIQPLILLGEYQRAFETAA
jgi:hypothetical protein